MRWLSNFSQSIKRLVYRACSAQGPCVIFVLREGLLEALQRVAHAALDCILRPTCDLSDVFERDVRELAQQEDLALLCRERLDGPRNAHPELVPDGDALHGRARRPVRGALSQRRSVAVLLRGLVERRVLSQ